VSDSGAVKQYLEKKELNNFSIFLSETVFPSSHFGLFSKGIVTTKELSVFCRQMSVVFFSRLTLQEGVKLIAEQTESVQLKSALTEIFSHMQRDFTLSEAMSMYGHVFTNYMLNMVNIGETNGTLDVVFANLADYYEKEAETKQKLKSSVTYPLIVGGFTAVLILTVILAVLPVFDSLSASLSVKLPVGARVISGFARALGQYFIIFMLILTAGAVGAVYYFRSPKGKIPLDKLILKFPPSRYIYSRIITARLSRSLAMLIKNGSSLAPAIDDLRPLVKNSIVTEKLRSIAADVRKGVQLSDALKTAEIFPDFFVKMTNVGQQTGKLDEILEKTADILDKEAEESFNKIISLTEPALTLILSVTIGAALLSIIIPVIGIMNSIG
jgi:type IV pilus assembly protein PilC